MTEERHSSQPKVAKHYFVGFRRTLRDYEALRRRAENLGFDFNSLYGTEFIAGQYADSVASATGAARDLLEVGPVLVI